MLFTFFRNCHEEKEESEDKDEHEDSRDTRVAEGTEDLRRKLEDPAGPRLPSLNFLSTNLSARNIFDPEKKRLDYEKDMKLQSQLFSPERILF